MDLMLITGTEDIDEVQSFFEFKSKYYMSPNLESKDDYELDTWDIFRRIEGDFDEEDKISDRQRAIRRIQNILQEVPSDIESVPVEKAKGKR